MSRRVVNAIVDVYPTPEKLIEAYQACTNQKEALNLIFSTVKFECNVRMAGFMHYVKQLDDGDSTKSNAAVWNAMKQKISVKMYQTFTENCTTEYNCHDTMARASDQCFLI